MPLYSRSSTRSILLPAALRQGDPRDLHDRVRQGLALGVVPAKVLIRVVERTRERRLRVGLELLRRAVMLAEWGGRGSVT